MTRRFRHFLWCFACLLSVMGIAVEVRGSESVRDKLRFAMSKINEAQGWPVPICGIYAATRAIRIVGHNVSLADGLKTEYVGSEEGSTADEIAQFIRDQGLVATSLRNLGAVDLAAARSPVIVNVRSDFSSSSYNHWVCALYDGEHLWIMDGPEPERQAKFADLMAVWNGYGIVVSRPEDRVETTIAMGRAFAFVFTAGTLAVFIAYVFRISVKVKVCWSWAVVSALCLAIGVLSVVGNSYFGDLTHFSEGVAHATHGAISREFSSVGYDALRAASLDDRILLIDATLPSTHAAGSIPNSVNVPVTTRFEDLRIATEELSHSTPIIVFCKSAECRYSHELADRLASLGFYNVKVGMIGIREYFERQAIEIGKAKTTG
jgi:rhodanese-related sulfurtransferase